MMNLEGFGFKHCWFTLSYSHNIFLWTKYKNNLSQDI
jgi:hypothetical protein